ncbi:MAG: hypothetical protein ABI905_05185 [Betaproteobacteria bacterium]
MAYIRPLLIAFLLAGALIAGLELRLASIGYQPSVTDSAGRWRVERNKASRLGDNALILVGASRIQLALDLEVLRRETGKQPVQLGIVGGSPTPVLVGLAADPAITGTIIVDYYDTMSEVARGDLAERYQKSFDAQKGRTFFGLGGDVIEAGLTSAVRDHLRMYANGTTPAGSLLLAWSGELREDYVFMAPDRSSRGDYSRVLISRAYLSRVMRLLGDIFPPDTPNLERTLQAKVDAISPSSNAAVLRQGPVIRDAIQTITRRGGRVLFVKFPSDGMVRQIEDRRYPRALFWDKFVALTGVTGIQSSDDEVLSGFNCPDGSHLDMRDRAAFTSRLVQVLGLEVTQGNNSPH